MYLCFYRLMDVVLCPKKFKEHFVGPQFYLCEKVSVRDAEMEAMVFSGSGTD